MDRENGMYIAIFYIYIWEYHSAIKKAIKRRKCVHFEMDLEGIMMNKVSQIEKDKYGEPGWLSW